MDKNQFVQMLEKHPQLKKDLFIRGFLITDRAFALNVIFTINMILPF